MANAGSHRDIVAIGASAGELPQVSMLLELLLPDLPAIVLVVLHRSGDQVSYLREVLACKSGTPVVEATARSYLSQHATSASPRNTWRSKSWFTPSFCRTRA